MLCFLSLNQSATFDPFFLFFFWFILAHTLPSYKWTRAFKQRSEEFWLESRLPVSLSNMTISYQWWQKGHVFCKKNLRLVVLFLFEYQWNSSECKSLNPAELSQNRPWTCFPVAEQVRTEAQTVFLLCFGHSSHFPFIISERKRKSFIDMQTFPAWICTREMCPSSFADWFCIPHVD